jgi:hypothetical protein
MATIASTTAFAIYPIADVYQIPHSAYPITDQHSSNVVAKVLRRE